MTDRLPGYDWLTSEQGQEFEFIGDKIDIGDEIGIAVRKGDALQARFNKAISEIRADGTYDEINAKYFPFNIY